MTEYLILAFLWFFAAVALGPLLGRCIKVGSDEPRSNVEDFETRRQQLRATVAHRVSR